MAYSEALARRLRKALAGQADVEEKKMFGGLCFLVAGHMALGIVGEELMVRVGKEGYAEALARPHARAMDFTGRPLAGMVYVGIDGIERERDLAGWIARGVAHARSLPPKAAKVKKAAPKERRRR